MLAWLAWCMLSQLITCLRLPVLGAIGISSASNPNLDAASVLKNVSLHAVSTHRLLWLCRHLISLTALFITWRLGGTINGFGRLNHGRTLFFFTYYSYTHKYSQVFKLSIKQVKKLFSEVYISW